jgi:hypothetical protein
MYEEEQRKFENLHKDLEGKVDGEINMDMHGNITVKSAKQDTYVLRNGKLVPGEGEKRE